ncbi:ABC transporter ATP-binding protein [Asanoa ishikariensis]|uniref:Monosaccharide ABC transporter ATP-binding protein, CUT2 family n=1 Tax=Asanoa ishikariensis TaxID=137265 RepID=A0A1H3UHQ4_9ACTN|nr:ATP-binding cassette domain-containing protein [Asanoa ishikariensis]GIF63611.1 ABC transporter ATP-binding protein [Asanoa ishikariensis]SDZ61335.1 monosaccharide ABC transporter ATP-binding protein, CUT2 family [Asanoa ishikariensis]
MTAVLEARGITKHYGHVEALTDANFDVQAGEVVALIGDNGAGKSTLVRILSGAESADGGEVLFDGKKITLTSPTDARELGMETVFQDLALAPHLSPVQNMYLGREVMRKGLLGMLGFMDNKAMRDGSRSAFDRLGATVRDLNGTVGGMSGGQRQGIAVARAAAWAQKVIFLDEPTAALGVVQTQNVLDLVRRVSGEGIGVVFISHSMPHVMEVADRIQVMWRGRRVATYNKADTSMEQLVSAMTGAVAQEAS